MHLACLSQKHLKENVSQFEPVDALYEEGTDAKYVDILDQGDRRSGLIATTLRSQRQEDPP